MGLISQSEASLISSFIFEIQAQRGSTDHTLLTRAWSQTRIPFTLHTFGSKLDNLEPKEVFRRLNRTRQSGISKNYLGIGQSADREHLPATPNIIR
jgi:hypothetical protein